MSSKNTMRQRGVSERCSRVHVGLSHPETGACNWQSITGPKKENHVQHVSVLRRCDCRDVMVLNCIILRNMFTSGALNMATIMGGWSRVKCGITGGWGKGPLIRRNHLQIKDLQFSASGASLLTHNKSLENCLQKPAANDHKPRTAARKRTNEWCPDTGASFLNDLRMDIRVLISQNRFAKGLQVLSEFLQESCKWFCKCSQVKICKALWTLRKFSLASGDLRVVASQCLRNWPQVIPTAEPCSQTRTPEKGYQMWRCGWNPSWQGPVLCRCPPPPAAIVFND